MLRIYRILPQKMRGDFYLLIVLLILYSLLEVVGIASIAPFVAIATSKNVMGIGVVQKYLIPFGINERNEVLLFAGLCFIGITVVSNVLRFFSSNRLFKYSTWVTEDLSFELLNSYLHRPYSFFVLRNSSELSKNVLVEVNHFIKGVLVPWLELISKSITAIAISSFLLISNPILSMSLFISSAMIYFVITVLFGKRTKSMGERSKVLNKQRFKIANESFGGIKDIKILGKEEIFLDGFKHISKEYAGIRIKHNIFTQAPRYFIESFALTGLVITILYLNLVTSSTTETISTIALYAFASYRLLPSLQAIFNAINNIQYSMPTLAILEKDLHREDKNENTVIESLPLTQGIHLDQVSYTYSGAKIASLEHLSLKIELNSTVGIVGKTGAGKSTLIDVITGLLVPTSGQMLIDNERLTEQNAKRWQKEIGYVAQQIYLSDDTVAANIAFGVPKSEIDMKRVLECARTANLHDFIESNLPHQYDTTVGERGIRLSGGQRQRIGIARALYRNPSVLIFDEATSSLDTQTEAEVMEAINNLQGKKTIIIIAHRLSTVKKCDQIFVMEAGSLKSSGRFEELKNNCMTFKILLSTSQLTA